MLNLFARRVFRAFVCATGRLRAAVSDKVWVRLDALLGEFKREHEERTYGHRVIPR